MTAENPSKPGNAEPATGKQTPFDWDALEPHYRAGIRTLRDLSVAYGPSPATIVKHANKHKWTRNLKAKIQARADALVNADAVNKAGKQIQSKSAKAAEALVVEVEGTVQSRIRLEQRHDIGRGRNLVMVMLSELESMTQSPMLLKDLQACLAQCQAGEDIPHAVLTKADILLGQALTLDSRAGVLKSLTDSLGRLVALEREAYGINRDAEFTDAFSEMLRGIQGKAKTFEPVAEDIDFVETPRPGNA